MKELLKLEMSKESKSQRLNTPTLTFAIYNFTITKPFVMKSDFLYSLDSLQVRQTDLRGVFCFRKHYE